MKAKFAPSRWRRWGRGRNGDRSNKGAAGNERINNNKNYIMAHKTQITLGSILVDKQILSTPNSCSQYLHTCMQAINTRVCEWNRV